MDNLIQEIIEGSGCTDDLVSVAASAKNSTTQKLGADDVSALINFATDQVISSDVRINSNNEFEFLTIGDYQVRLQLNATMTVGGGFSRWFVFYELDTGGGFANIANMTSMKSFNTADAGESRPVTMQTLILNVTVANTKLRVRQQTDNASESVGIMAFTAGGIIPNNVPSAQIDIVKVSPA